MKHSFRVRICLLSALLVVLPGCTSVQKKYVDSWYNKQKSKTRGSLWLESVKVDRSQDRDSLEDEVRNMAPLLFLDAGFSGGGPDADYAAEIRVRERNFIQGWKTKNSLAVELKIWRNTAGGHGVYPLSAGRVIFQGNTSIASSAILNRMMEKAMKKAARPLPKVKRLPGGS